MKIEETTVTTQAPTDAETHVLEPGDCCVGADGIFGVVVKSQSNTDQIVLVKFGAEPIRDYDRAGLKWVGEID